MRNPKSQPPKEPPGRKKLNATDSPLIVTNLVKLAGVAIAINEALLRGELRPVAMAVAALMIAGATGVESFLDRMFGRRDDD